MKNILNKILKFIIKDVIGYIIVACVFSDRIGYILDRYLNIRVFISKFGFPFRIIFN